MKKQQFANDMETQSQEKPIEKFTLPANYDVVSEYQENIEQGIVDSLFDYFGKVYYKSDLDTQGKKVRNNYISKYDSKILKMFARRTNMLWFIFAILFILGVAGILGVLFGFGFDLTSIMTTTSSWPGSGLLWTVVFSIIVGLSGGCLLLSIVLFISVVYWMRLDKKFAKKIKQKIAEWNRVFDRFSKSLDQTSILNAIQSGIPDFVLDKRTPAYDRKIYNIHNRIYSYSGIPQDAKRIAYKNTLSGFYKGAAFSLSTSTWEWFRDAKVVEEQLNESSASLKINVRRSLKRYEDSICLLVVDTFADPRLNFVLNNPEGKNIRLQNDIFNNIFSLAVNNAKYAYNVFTPYAQHSLSRLKTWTGISKNIRQVIKEGSKIYVILDADNDFFKFNRVVDPSLNYVFNSKNISENTVFKNGEIVLSSDKKQKKNRYKIKCGSLDETASLMTEYILEEVDLLFTALEMATCFPADDAFKKESRSTKSKTLLKILEEKRSKDYSDEIANQLSISTDEVTLLDSEFNVPDWNAEKTPTFKPLVNVDID